MDREEKLRYLTALGLTEKAAAYYLRYDTDTRAVVPAFRLLKPLDDDLAFFRGEYSALLKQWQAEGSLDALDPWAGALMKAGAGAELVEQFAYVKTLQAYEQLLYQLDDHAGAEQGEAFDREDFSRCGYGRLMEMGPDGEPTGRVLFDVHGMLPFSEEVNL